MARREPSLFGRLLRALFLFALALVAIIAATIAFMPWDRLAPALAQRIERETRIETRIEALAMEMSARGPVVEARGVDLHWPTGETLHLEALSLRPAKPSEWLRGVPTAFVTADAAFGSFEGDVSRERLLGDFTDFDFAQLPPAWFGEGGSPLAGPVDAHVDLARLAEQWSGAAKIQGGEGSLALPGAPVAIPYERLAADARLDEVGTLHLDALSLSGPMVVASAKGEIEAGYAGPATGAIAIEALIERMDPSLVPALADYGLTLDPSGAGRVVVSGTPDQVLVR
jgi:hypothetical protein